MIEARIERATDGDRKDGQAAYLERLMAKLGDGRDWEYRGECGEDGQCGGVCSCGHTGLRWLFQIHHRTTGARAIVGSTCISHFELANPELVGAIRADADRLMAEARDRERAAAELTRQNKVQVLLAEWNRGLWALDAELVRGDESGGGSRNWSGQRRVSYEAYRQSLTPSVAKRRLFGDDRRRVCWRCGSEQLEQVPDVAREYVCRLCRSQMFFDVSVGGFKDWADYEAKLAADDLPDHPRLRVKAYKRTTALLRHIQKQIDAVAALLPELWEA